MCSPLVYAPTTELLFPSCLHFFDEFGIQWWQRVLLRATAGFFEVSRSDLVSLQTSVLMAYLHIAHLLLPYSFRLGRSWPIVWREKQRIGTMESLTFHAAVLAAQPPTKSPAAMTQSRRVAASIAGCSADVRDVALRLSQAFPLSQPYEGLG